MKRFVLTTLLVAAFAAVAAADINRVGTVAEGREFPRIVDLDGNGIDDLVHDTFVLLGQGAGQFVRRELGFGGDNYVVDWLDVNGDGRADLLSKNYGGRGRGSVFGVPAHQIHIATGAPLEFAPGIELTPLAGDSEPFIGDFDGDGKDDILLVKILFKGVRDYAAQLTVQLSRGDGTFEKRTPFLIPTHPQWGRYSRHVLMGDLNGDGRRDVVIRTTDDLAVLTSIGGGDFTVSSHFLPIHFGWWDHDLGDIDGDGKLDLIAAGKREVRVYFGDGRSGFNRTTKLFLPQYRSPQLPNSVPSHALNLSSEAPRNLTVGEFVTKGRAEITGSTLEGDIFVVAYENGSLREVAPRVETEFVQGDLYVGSFRAPGSRDLLATYNLVYVGQGNPRPGLFSTNPARANVIAAPARSGRGRAVGQPTADLKLRVEGKDCASDTTIRTLVRQGFLGRSRQAGESFDAVIDEDGLLYFRYFPKWYDPYPLFGKLEPRAGGGWEGTTSIGSWPCGEQDIRIVVER